MEGGGRPSVLQAALLVAGTGLTALLYTAYRHQARLARGLQDARRLRLDGELRAVLREAPGHCVPYAVIEEKNNNKRDLHHNSATPLVPGVVCAVKDTLSSQFVDNCKGVIHQRTNTTAFNLAPLEDGAGVAVRVMKPLEAAELSLETVHKEFHRSVQSFPDVIGHYISGERPKGIQELEQMLKVGAALTGIGELVLDNNTIKLQPPKQGLHYYLTSTDFDTLLQKQESSARLWKLLSVLFGFATCAFLFFLLRKQYLHYRERQHLKQMQEEFRQVQERLMCEMKADGVEMLKNACVICLNSTRSCAFLEQPISRAVPLYNS
ncbi:hypothetical protein ASZ78_009961 [Callipepla squamata]|uniref:RING-type E3 ubiquitin transferase n=1 Tax=Callipepla squamata TaxID=9009 RepID=A0A226NA51_CALSU|nr:hypothetical protein ASZ78_009961 [Callipepla squamata]